MKSHVLSLALSKTDSGGLTKKHISTIIPMSVGDVDVEIKPMLKFLLGITIHIKMRCGEQIQRTGDKAYKAVNFVGRVMDNVGGPSSSICRLFITSVKSVLFYGAEGLAHAIVL